MDTPRCTPPELKRTTRSDRKVKPLRLLSHNHIEPTVAGGIAAMTSMVGLYEPTQVFAAIPAWKAGDRFVVPARDPDDRPIPRTWAERGGVVVNDRAEIAVLEKLTEYLFGVRFDDDPDTVVTLSHRWMNRPTADAPDAAAEATR